MLRAAFEPSDGSNRQGLLSGFCRNPSLWALHPLRRNKTDIVARGTLSPALRQNFDNTRPV